MAVARRWAVITSWKESGVSDAFEAYRDLPEQILGYRTVFRELGLQRPDRRDVLDYGCGPGKVALRLVRSSDKRVVAVDESPGMIAIAREKRAHPRIDYRLIRDDRLPFLADGSMDAAMACYVFINTATEERLLRIAREVHRTLGRGAPFVVLDTNPDSTGVEFSTFRNGRPGKHYGRGEAREEWLRVPGRADLVLRDRHWPKEAYHEVLEEAGFGRVEQHEPTLNDVPADELREFEKTHGPCNWKGEWMRPPFVVFSAFK